MNFFRLITFIALSILLSAMFKVSYADPPLPTPVARVIWIKGDALKATMPNKEERLLQKQSVIYLHDILSTNENTTAEIAFTDNTLITFQPNTIFSIEEYHYQLKKKNNSVGKNIMKLIEGGFRTITGLIAKTNPKDYQVKTPIATIGVRGTDYAVYLKNGELFVAYYQGTPCVSSNENKTEVCLNKEHPYAKVHDANSAPEYLTEQPEGFRNKLEITDAKIDLFETFLGVGGNGGTPGGPITSFCIQ